MLIECLFECCWFPLCMMIKMHLCMINIPLFMFLVQIIFKNSVHEFYLSLYMFMGWLARASKASSRVLYAGRRHGDVTSD